MLFSLLKIYKKIHIRVPEFANPHYRYLVGYLQVNGPHRGIFSAEIKYFRVDHWFWDGEGWIIDMDIYNISKKR